jgi:hypothetical protein
MLVGRRSLVVKTVTSSADAILVRLSEDLGDMNWIRLSAFTVVMIGGMASCSSATQVVSSEDSMLQFFPRDTDIMLFIDVAGLRGNQLVENLVREHSGTRIPRSMEGFLDWAGLNLMTDVDQVAVGASSSGELLAVLRANYDSERVASYFREHDVPAETYGRHSIYDPDTAQNWKLSFVESYMLMGPDTSLRGAINRIESPDSTALNNVDLVDRLREIADGYHVWAVGTSSSGSLLGRLGAPQMASDLFRSVRRGTYQMRLDEAVTAQAVAEFATPEAARRTSALLQGLVTLGRIQADRWPWTRETLDGLEIQDVESAVRLTFAVDSDVLRRRMSW